MESTPQIPQKTNKGGNNIYEICGDISKLVGATIGVRTPENDESKRTLIFNWSKKRLSHLLIQRGRTSGIIPRYIHSIDVLGQPSGAKRRWKIHQYHIDGQNLRDVAEDYEDGEQRCQREIVDPIQEILSEKLGILALVDFWPKNIMVAPETAQKIEQSLKNKKPFQLDNEDAIFVNVDPDHWVFNGEKVRNLLSRDEIPLFAKLQ